MKKDKKKLDRIIVFTIIGIFVLCSIPVQSIYTEGVFWSRIDNTIVLTNVWENVSIGKNDTTNYKLFVNGTSFFMDTLFGADAQFIRPTVQQLIVGYDKTNKMYIEVNPFGDMIFTCYGKDIDLLDNNLTTTGELEIFGHSYFYNDINANTNIVITGNEKLDGFLSVNSNSTFYDDMLLFNRDNVPFGVAYSPVTKWFISRNGLEETILKLYSGATTLFGGDIGFIDCNKALQLNANNGSDNIILNGVVIFENNKELGFGGGGSFKPYFKIMANQTGSDRIYLNYDMYNPGGSITDWYIYFNRQNNNMDFAIKGTNQDENLLYADAELNQINITNLYTDNFVFPTSVPAIPVDGSVWWCNTNTTLLIFDGNTSDWVEK